MGMDPKMLSDPNLMAMYSMGMPGLLPPSGSPATSISNGAQCWDSSAQQQGRHHQ